MRLAPAKVTICELLTLGIGVGLLPLPPSLLVLVDPSPVERFSAGVPIPRLRG